MNAVRNKEPKPPSITMNNKTTKPKQFQPKVQSMEERPKSSRSKNITLNESESESVSVFDKTKKSEAIVVAGKQERYIYFFLILFVA
jgi:hypothetical protein